MKKKKLFIIIAFSILLLAISIFLFIELLPYINRLKNPVYQEKFRSYIDSLGVWGVLLMFFLQFLQVVIAIIPGEPIEIIAGVMYGPFWGTILCLAGTISGAIFIFWFIRKVGSNFVFKIFGKKKVQEYRFLKDKKRVLILTFILYLIPGTPKDILNYIAPLSNIKLVEFLVVSTIARIPSVASSTIAGSNITTGNLKISLIVFSITVVIGIIGIIIGNKFNKKCQKEFDDRKEKN